MNRKPATATDGRLWPASSAKNFRCAF